MWYFVCSLIRTYCNRSRLHFPSLLSQFLSFCGNCSVTQRLRVSSGCSAVPAGGRWTRYSSFETEHNSCGTFFLDHRSRAIFFLPLYSISVGISDLATVPIADMPLYRILFFFLGNFTLPGNTRAVRPDWETQWGICKGIWSTFNVDTERPQIQYCSLSVSKKNCRDRH